MVKKIKEFQDTLDKAYDKANLAYSKAFIGMPTRAEDPSGLKTVGSSKCGGFGVVFANRFDGKSRLSNQLKEWCDDNKSKCNKYFNEGYYGMTLTLKFKVDPDIVKHDKASEQCTVPKEKAYKAFLGSLEKDGIDVGSARVSTYLT